MDKKNVLVTGIGGNVGQGIIRNIKADFDNIRIVGTNVTDFSAGNHLCDKTYMIPYAYDPAYIASVNQIVKDEHIDLIVPSTDYEVFYLAQNAAIINTAIAASGVNSAKIYLDKYLTYQHHSAHNIPFADATLPSKYKGGYKNYIAKPRKGRGSRGLHINPANYSTFSDDEYMIQEMHAGEEITTAFYVNKQNRLHGLITMVRQLDNGATVQSKVISTYNEQLIPIIDAMIQYGNIKGAANIQSIVSDEGKIFPFEVNCRISGTNSIRSNFGFKDVKYTIQEFLYNEEPDKPVITPGIATRILMDVIYPDTTDYSQCVNNSNYYLF
jgi:carbamoyl-phosphate synthase large subunit